MTAQEIASDIVSACQKLRGDGFVVEKNSFGFRNGEGKVCGGCALTALAVANGADVRGEEPSLICTNTVRGFAAHRYAWKGHQVSGFIDGFDGTDRNDSADQDAYDIGSAVRGALFAQR